MFFGPAMRFKLCTPALALFQVYLSDHIDKLKWFYSKFSNIQVTVVVRFSVCGENGNGKTDHRNRMNRKKQHQKFFQVLAEVKVRNP